MENQKREAASGPLYVKTLGQFSVFRGSQQLAETAWVRAKARILFQYFITNRKRFSLRERITYELWPSLDPERANRDFKVALNAVNNALRLENLESGEIEFIQRQDLSYGLSPSSLIIVDADLFEQKVSQGRKVEISDPQLSAALYHEGLDLYLGEFLPDRLYDDWSSLERERLTSLFLLSAASLARLLLADQRYDEAIIWSSRVSAIDPLWEEAYRIQMNAFNANGNRPKAIQIYNQCLQVLQDQLGVQPMTETTNIYQELLRS